MNTKDLVDAISKKNGISANMAKKIVRTTFGEITSVVQKGGKVTLVGFGTFSSHKRKARTARNPRTGETVKLSASKYPKFKAGKGFKEAVNSKGSTVKKKVTKKVAKKATTKKKAVQKAKAKTIKKPTAKKAVTARAAKKVVKKATKKVARKVTKKAAPKAKKIARKVSATVKKTTRKKK